MKDSTTSTNDFKINISWFIASLIASAAVGCIICNFINKSNLTNCETNLNRLVSELQACQAELEECRAAVVPPSTVSYAEAKIYVGNYITNNSNYAAAFQVSTDMIRSLYADMFTNPTISGYRGYYGHDATQNPTKEFVIFRGIDSNYSETGNGNNTFMSFSHTMPPSGSHDIVSMFYNPCPMYCDRGPSDTSRDTPGWQ